jgi:hypothetical protein
MSADCLVAVRRLCPHVFDHPDDPSTSIIHHEEHEGRRRMELGERRVAMSKSQGVRIPVERGSVGE